MANLTGVTVSGLAGLGKTMNKGGSPYDAKFNVAEIGAVNMDEIGAVRKRSR